MRNVRGSIVAKSIVKAEIDGVETTTTANRGIFKLKVYSKRQRRMAECVMYACGLSYRYLGNNWFDVAGEVEGLEELSKHHVTIEWHYAVNVRVSGQGTGAGEVKQRPKQSPHAPAYDRMDRKSLPITHTVPRFEVAIGRKS